VAIKIAAMNTIKKFAAALAFVLLILPASAQREKVLSPADQKAVKKEANAAFSAGEYMSALDEYNRLIKADPENADYNYKLGVIYVNTFIDYSKAVPYLEKAAEKGEAPKEVYYYLGRAYHLNNKFQEAIASYQKYREVQKSKTPELNEVNRQIEMAENAKDLIKRPIDVSFENVGKEINSAGREFNPIVSGDGTMMVFTSRRKGNLGGLIDASGLNTSDVFFSTFDGKSWSKAKNVGPTVNTPYDDISVGLSHDGSVLYVYSNENQSTGDIFQSRFTGRSFQKAELLKGKVNTKDDEAGATLSPDGMTLYFSSDRKGGKGGRDLYLARKLPDGSFANPVSLGEPVNTGYDEDYPFIAADGITLYFSSKGHESMGGFDIFKTIYNESTQTWSRPENLGYPVNNAGDNMSFSITANGRTGFAEYLMEDGQGDLDIYRITFNTVTGRDPVTIFRGLINNPFEDQPFIATVTLKTKGEEEKLMGTYTPDPVTGAFIMLVPAGNYTYTIEAPGFLTYMEDLTVPQLRQDREVVKNIIIGFDQGAEYTE
jgi:tetratricopeptide (TPR) repeat protein